MQRGDVSCPKGYTAIQWGIEAQVHLALKAMCKRGNIVFPHGYHYGVNICVSSGILTLDVIVLGGGASGKGLGHEGWSLRMDQSPYKEMPEIPPLPLLPWEDTASK